MKTNTFRRMTALVLSIMLVLSMCMTGISVSATESTKTIYVRISNNWLADNARFAAYSWTGSVEGTFTSMTKIYDGLYSTEIPASKENIIFLRMDPLTTENNWDNKWNQSADIVIPADRNTFKLNEGEWDGANGIWVQYCSPVTAPTTKPVETTIAPTTVPGPDALPPRIIYFVPNSNWCELQCRFVAYVWESNNEGTFVSMTKDSNGIYKAYVQKKYTNIIFIAMNPDTYYDDWDNKWCQTVDLEIPDSDMSIFYTNQGLWDGATGTWQTLPPPTAPPYTTIVPTTEPTETTTTPTTAPTTSVINNDRSIFFVPSSGWCEANARFSLYVWSNNNEFTFIPMKKYDDRTYFANVPNKYTHCIFVRMNPDITEDTWENKWNQTVDIIMPYDETSCFTLNENEWDGATGTWTIIPGPLPTTKPTTKPTTVTEPTETTVTLPTAPTNLPQQKLIFFNPSDDWETDNARFAMYMWADGKEGSFVSMTKTTNDYYVAELADGCTNVIFVRMNPSLQDNNWNNRWNQTTDLKVSEHNNLFTLNDGEWENANGVWSYYDYNLGEFTKFNDIYFIPNKAWRENNARFVMYMWAEGYEGQFVPMKEVADGVYSAVLAPYLPNIIFLRMDPNSSENSFDKKWNQTSAVKYGFNANTCFVLNENETEGATGVWTQFIGSTYPTVTEPTTYSNIYFVPSKAWRENNARFAMYIWGDGNEGRFVSMEKLPNGMYTAPLAPNCTDVIFVRLDPNSSENNWETKWNITVDLKIPAEGNRCFILNENEWDNANGEWSFYTIDATISPVTSEPATTEPTAPINEVSIFGDIDLTLEATEKDIYSASVELQASTYKFNVNNNGVTLGFNGTFTDTSTIDYSGGFKAQSTLKATGGRYTFTFNASTKKLSIKFKSFEDIVELVGDINVELVRPKKTSTVFTGTIRLDAGTYSFNVNENGNLFGFNYTFEDVIYNKEFIWATPAKFVATGGIYSVRYDTATNQLKIMHAPVGLGNTTVFGDISLPLAEQGNGIYSAQTVLDAGSYDIRFDSFGKIFGCGSQFADTINTEFKTDWKAAATLTVTSKMKFTFSFDTNTNKVKVFSTPIDTTKVKVAFDEIDALELTSVDGVTYTAKTTLEAGTYTFRMDEFGTPMGGKYIFTDNNSNMVYDASYASATTFNATGGTYTFLFNTKTNALKVTKG